jgi:hypothetical protein
LPPPGPLWDRRTLWPYLRRRAHRVDIGNVRAVVATVGTLFSAFLVFWQGISLADGDGVGAVYAPMYRANVTLRWPLAAASLTLAASFLPLLPARVQRAFVWTALALALGSVAAWPVLNHFVQ